LRRAVYEVDIRILIPAAEQLRRLIERVDVANVAGVLATNGLFDCGADVAGWNESVEFTRNGTVGDVRVTPPTAAINQLTRRSFLRSGGAAGAPPLCSDSGRSRDR